MTAGSRSHVADLAIFCEFSKPNASKYLNVKLAGIDEIDRAVVQGTSLPVA